MESKKRELNKKKVFSLVGGVIVLAAVVGGILYWQFGRDAVASNTEQQSEIIRSENQALLDQVRTHIILPEGEEPTIATIDNAEDLARLQDFFKHSQNGDKLIIYPQAKRAFIYSPSRDIMVSAGPTYFENTQLTSTDAGTEATESPESETTP